MSTILEEAIKRLSTLPTEEQDAIGAQILETLETDAAWKAALDSDPDKLDRLADQALEDYKAGRTVSLEDVL